MTDNELKQWVKHHDVAFPGFLKWVKTASEGGDPNTVTKRFELWSNRLRRVTGDMAVKATEYMFEKGFDQPFNRHIGYVVEWNSRHTQEPIDRIAARICGLCNGTGIVSVQFFEPRLTIGGHQLPDNIGQAACKCSSGRHINNCRTIATHPDATQFEWFDEKRMKLHSPKPRPREEIVNSLRTNGNLKLAAVIETLGLR